MYILHVSMYKMKKTKFIKLIVLSFISILSILSFVSAQNVPNIYKANYTIIDDWENIKRIFVQIEAKNQIWEAVSSSEFLSLYNSFSNVFPKFPQDYWFQITYEKCKSLSLSLYESYNTDTFSSFMSNCFRPFSNILNQIDSSYTVKANIRANPSTWPAPLTVTLNAAASTDPSSETIPENNYYWYYRDVNGVDQVIWNKSIISYTFPNPWVHIVHLTVRSSNYNKGIFDWENSVSIDVRPMSAKISIYANWKKLKSTEKLKFGTQEWINWIYFDWSMTIPIWERVIESHKWSIVGWNGFSITKEWAWAPGIIKADLPNEWEYKITLTTTDNEFNSVSETYSIVLADPVAIIKRTPEQWNTSTTFTFDASPSYSVTSTIKLYTREIFDSNGNKKTTYQWKSIKYQFIEPGSYTVKLTATDNLWESNTDTNVIFVDSSDPVAQFKYEPVSNRKYPSKFILDGSVSSDIDVKNWVDELTYSWNFSNPETTTIENIEWKNKIVKVSFDSLWDQVISLTVTDKYWKSSEVEKKINIQSILRPELIIAPRAVTRGNPITFLVQSNQKILSYSWNFGDGTSSIIQTNKVTHIFSKIGMYNINLTVNWENWQENTIIEKVFIWEKNRPIAAYKVKNRSNDIIRENDECIDWWTTYPAYKVTRYENIIIDPSDSVNTKWTNSNLKYFFRPKYWEIYNTNQFRHNFNELWCNYVDMTVEDTVMWLETKQRIWFKVYNSLPTLDNVILSFPQYGNEIGIWFNQNSAVNDVFDSDVDLTVKVTATSAKDTDWFISYFKWYYYYKDDPSRWLETKITPSTINYTYFQLKEPWEYMFGVTIYDNDDWKTVSEETLGNGPIVLLTQDSKNVDIPIVTLKENRVSVDVWEEVTFSVVAKIISDRSDFLQERTIRYDFDGDGEWDLITKDDEVTYVYETANEDWYTPRVGVLYRWYEWTAKWWTIIVKEWLKPRLLTTSAWKFVLFRDVSLWKIETDTTCLSLVDCRKNKNWFLFNSKKPWYYAFEYPKYDKYLVSVDLTDEFANAVNKKFELSLEGIELEDGSIVNYTWPFKLLTIPEYQDNWQDPIEIFVWNSLNNSVLFYVLNQYGTWDCYVDLDITDDKEIDFSCNEIHLEEYEPQYISKIWRIYYENSWETLYREFSVSFLDYSVKLDENIKEIYERLLKITNNVSDENLRILLLNLQNWLLSESETTTNTIALQEYLASDNKINIELDQKEELLDIINELELTNPGIADLAWWTVYDKAKAEILWILPRNLRMLIVPMFNDFEIAESDIENWETQQDHRKEILQNILNKINENATDDLESQTSSQIYRPDMEEVVIPNMCKIMDYYNITSTSGICSQYITDTKPIDDTQDIQQVKWKKVSTWLRILVITLSSLIWIFVLLVIFFAVKAKINRQKDDEEE